MGKWAAMMTLPTGNKRNADSCRPAAFTLIELILVMAMLLIVLGVAFPSLKGFFKGRNLDYEARRFLSLTTYGQSRAISEGVPIILWIDAERRAYGLQVQAGYTESDGKAVEYTLDKDLQMAAEFPARPATTPWKPKIAGLSNVPMIRFMPDGTISETSPDRIVLRQGSDDSIFIVENTNRLAYAIQTEDATTRLR
jgi:type IV fimbrial biogenesis protein FimT